MSAPFAYDVVPYDTKPNESTHPAALALVARLFGIDAARPSTSRTLELGCGNGENLLAAATYLPEARFVGVDLAEGAIALGKDAAARAGVTNVALHHADVCALSAPNAITGEPFDYVVAHGLYSWVPEPVRRDALKAMRAALAPNGVGFLSFNALPGWELSRAMRDLVLHATRAVPEPQDKVERALAMLETLARAGERESGFFGALAGHAAIWLEHVERSLPPDAPFSWYAFHDLLAECNDAFSVAEMDGRLAAAGLRRVAETPLTDARFAAEFPGLDAILTETGLPFLQLVVCRNDVVPLDAPSGERALDLVTATPDGFARAGDAGAEASTVLARWQRGELPLFAEAPPVLRMSTLADRPKVADHVRAKAAGAVDRNASAAVLTSGLHASFTVPWAELVVVRELDGENDRAAIAARVAETLVGKQGLAAARVEKHVEGVLERFLGHGFLVGS